MPMLLFIVIIGAAAGFFATRIMRVNTDVPTTVVIGIVGAVFGWIFLRILMALAGYTAMFVGAVLGAIALIWLWKTYTNR